MESSTPPDRGECGRASVLGEASPALRLLFVVPYAPRFDSRHGGRVTAQLLRRLVDRHHVAVVYQRPPGSAPMDPELARSCVRVREVRFSTGSSLGPAWEHQQRVLRSLLGGRPAPASAVYSRQFAEIVRETALEFSPDVTQVEQDALGYCLPVLDGLGGARILVCHDPGITASRDLVGVTHGRRQLAHRLDVRAWRRYWSHTISQAEAVVTFTSEDARSVTAAVPSTRVQAIPLGIDIPSEPDNPLGTEPLQVMFIGGYVHPPNADAAMRLIRDIMPAVRRRRPGLGLTLVGDQPTKDMLAAATVHDTITGAVPSVDPFVDQAALLVVPVRLGGGMRVKLLEGLAAGKAIVASPRATAGLDVTDAKQLRIADTDEEFAEAILELLAEPNTRREMATAARSWSERNLGWEDRVNRYEKLYRTLALGPARVPAAER